MPGFRSSPAGGESTTIRQSRFKSRRPRHRRLPLLVAPGARPGLCRGNVSGSRHEAGGSGARPGARGTGRGGPWSAAGRRGGLSSSSPRNGPSRSLSATAADMRPSHIVAGSRTSSRVVAHGKFICDVAVRRNTPPDRRARARPVAARPGLGEQEVPPRPRAFGSRAEPAPLRNARALAGPGAAGDRAQRGFRSELRYGGAVETLSNPSHASRPPGAALRPAPPDSEAVGDGAADAPHVSRPPGFKAPNLEGVVVLGDTMPA